MRENPSLTETEVLTIARALADPRRFRILGEIANAGTLYCQAMRKDHPVSAATISHHMKELESAGLIDILRDGKFATMRFRHDTMAAYLAYLGRNFPARANGCTFSPADLETAVD